MKKTYTWLICLCLISFGMAETVITEINIEGVQPEEEAQVRSVLPFSVNAPYSRETIAAAIRSLYETEQFKNVSVETEETGEDEIALTISVERNLYCDIIEIEGYDEFSKREIMDSIAIDRGILITDQLLYETEKTLEQMYSEKGYNNADIDITLTESNVDGYAIVTIAIDEKERVYIDEISFNGNEAFSNFRLRRRMKETKERHIFSRGAFDENQFQSDLDEVISYYRNHGYLDARIADTAISSTEEDPNALTLSITVEEGPEYYAGNIFFEGNTVFTDEELMQNILLSPGSTFEYDRYEQTTMQIGTMYRNDGYLYSQIEPEFVYRNDTIDVIYAIMEGRPAKVGLVTITGNSKTREQVIRRNLRIYPGQEYSQEDIQRSVRELHQLEYFESIHPDIVPRNETSNIVDIIFRVVEKEHLGQFSAGVSYSGDGGFGGNASVSIPNFRGTGERVDVEFQKLQERSRISGSLVKPWIFNRPVTYTGRIYWENVDYTRERFQIYNYERFAVESGLGRRFTWPDDYWSGSFRYLIGKDKYNRDYSYTEERLNVNIVSEGILSRLYLRIGRDDKDRPQFPSSGSAFNVSAYLGGLGGDYNYLKTIVDYEWHMPLFWKFVLGTKGKIGMINPLQGDTPHLGHNDLFRVGGVYYDGVIRGYSDRDFPENLNMATVSSQISFPVVDQTFYLAGFLDGGNNFQNFNELGSDIYMGTGFGFRLMLPMVGLIGFDFAVPLNDVNALGFEKEASRDWTSHFIMNSDF
jgi:outer membrane protein insertion porin family